MRRLLISVYVSSVRTGHKNRRTELSFWFIFMQDTQSLSPPSHTQGPVSRKPRKRHMNGNVSSLGMEGSLDSV